MSKNYIRKCSITLPGCGPYDATGIRVRFQIKQSTIHQVNVATIRLTNQNRDLAAALVQKKGGAVSISAGYADNMGLLFQGDLRKAIYGRENPTDTLTTILAADGGQGVSYATVGKTLPPGSTPRDIVDVAMASLKQYGLGEGFIGPLVNLAIPVYPRSIALFGMAYKLLKDVAKSKYATVSIQNSLMHMVTPQDALPGVYELNSATGLIGMPTLEMGGLYARVLINPQLRVNGKVHIDQKLIQGMIPALDASGQIRPEYDPKAPDTVNITADGIYRIYRIDVDADTRGGPWYQDLAMSNLDKTTTAQIYSTRNN